MLSAPCLKLPLTEPVSSNSTQTVYTLDTRFRNATATWPSIALPEPLEREFQSKARAAQLDVRSDEALESRWNEIAPAAFRNRNGTRIGNRFTEKTGQPKTSAAFPIELITLPPTNIAAVTYGVALAPSFTSPSSRV